MIICFPEQVAQSSFSENYCKGECSLRESSNASIQISNQRKCYSKAENYLFWSSNTSYFIEQKLE